MIKQGKEAKVDERDKETYDEVQKLVEKQEAKLKEETDGPSILSAVSLWMRCRHPFGRSAAAVLTRFFFSALSGSSRSHCE